LPEFGATGKDFRRSLALPRRIGEKQFMSDIASVAIHASQFPESVRRDLIESLRCRRVNHKFHYDSVKQTQQWLALHQAHSPSRNDMDCAATYDRSFAAVASQVKARRIHLIGLGCGGGQKDTRLLKFLRARGREVFYTPCDVSTAMVLVARQAALAVVPERNCFPLVCDLAATDDWSAALDRRRTPHALCLTTFFGMIPNFEPHRILPGLVSLVRPNDGLLFSANLAPGNNYAAGLKRILPQYDNPLTREWLMTFLFDLGVGRRDGHLRFTIEGGGFGLKRVMARFHFSRPCRIEIENEQFNFRAGESIRLFFSYRYTPGRVVALLARHGLEIREQWITRSEEEGVFLCRRK
jgi:L-histidine N-alpha-methyltransferase